MKENTTRLSVPAIEALLGQSFPVLDDGFVRVVDYLGGDTAIVQAARVSYGEGTKTPSDDGTLIRYLMRHAHTTPFEMCELKLHVRVPMDTWRQWIRHRTANVNEYSTRYSVAIDRMAVTSPDRWRTQDPRNRQGSAEHIDVQIGASLTQRETELQTLAHDIYAERLGHGVAREQARKDLPLSTYTEAYWKIDLHNLLHFLRLRLNRHAQHEIRQYASVIGQRIVAAWVPLTWQAFNDYALNTTSFSAIEVDILGALLREGPLAAIQAADQHGWLARDGNGAPRRNRERAEFEEKLLTRLGIPAPWLNT
ncbi:MAG TPA: FAD-dependent thymidylate synthase [Thermoanaerobaculia bacterium]|jgi:thymidylate synthase (FAD)